MKKLIFAIFIISSFQVLHAQEDEVVNKYIVGGSMSFLNQNNTYPLGAISINTVTGGIFSNSTDETKNSTFSLTPYIGREINRHWLAGILFDYRVTSYSIEGGLISPLGNDFKRSTTQLGVG